MKILNIKNMEIEVSFIRKIVEVNEHPFEIMINESLLEDERKNEFTWCWYAELQRFENSEMNIRF